MQYTPAQVAQQVLNQGGSKAQAWVAAALVDGIESSGDPTAKNPSSTACGLFQFLDTTWASNGGTKYAPTACGATWEQQISVFLTASAGSNFYPWAPDLGGSYNGNTKQPAATAPQPGSPVAGKIASLAASGTMSFLGNVPTNWADAGAATPGSGPAAASPSSTGGLSKCYVGINVPSAGGAIISLFTLGLAGGGSSQICFLTKGNVKWFSGAFCIVAGAGIAGFGIVLLASAIGKSTGATAAVKRAGRTVGVPAALLSGQPEVAAGVSAATRPPPASSPSIRPAGRLESRRIESRYRSAVRENGPLGPRGSNPTANRIAREGRRGTSSPGPRRRREPPNVPGGDPF
jgi:hypothetical protein